MDRLEKAFRELISQKVNYPQGSPERPAQTYSTKEQIKQRKRLLKWRKKGRAVKPIISMENRRNGENYERIRIDYTGQKDAACRYSQLQIGLI